VDPRVLAVDGLVTRARRVAVCLGVVLALASIDASAATPLPAPGTPQQIVKLVANASKIRQLPRNLVPNLAQASADDVGTYYPTTQFGCLSMSSCQFGDLKSHSTIMLFGDSHAQMWLTSLVPIAVKYRLKLVLVWRASCPAATVTVWDVSTGSTYTACNVWRAAALKSIRRLNPSLVLLAGRNTDITGAGNAAITQPTWQAGLVHTIVSLKSKVTKVAVIGDITTFSAILPDCLAADYQQIQRCSSADPNPKETNHFAAEVAAAKATGVLYINPHPWLCTSVCSPVIGNMVAYYNNNHVSATYAAFLSSVWLHTLHAELP
jgi:SGNH domain (fused to AT3 domains)